MRRAPRIDRDLARYLVPGEQVVTAVRQHWFSQARAVLLTVGITLLTVSIDVNAPGTAGGKAMVDAAWLGWLIALAWLAWRLLNWRRDFFVATDKRFLLFYGFIRRKVAMMPLLKVTDMTFDRSVPGRLIGYGSFVLESAGHDQALSHIDYVPDADAHYRAICSVLFGGGVSRPAAWEDADGWEDDDPGGPDGPGGPDDPRDRGGPDGPGGPRPGDPHDPGGRGARRWWGGWGRTEPDGLAEPPVEPDWVDDGYAARPGSRRPSRPHGEAPSTARSLYRSPDLVRAMRDADTGEIPVVPARPDRRHPRR